MKKIINWLRIRKWRKIIKESGMFDEKYYLFTYPDVRFKDIDPIVHYIKYGALEKRNPSKSFNTDFYLTTYKDVQKSGINPLVHFIMFGNFEKRSTKYTNTKGIESSHQEQIKQILKQYNGNIKYDDKKQNLLVVAHSVSDMIFGAERSFLDMLTGLQLTNLNILVCIPNNSHSNKYAEQILPLCTTVFSFNYGWWQQGKFNQKPIISTFKSLIIQHSVDLVYVNTIIIPHPLIAAKSLNIPSILHVREIISKDDNLLKLIGDSSNQIISLLKKTTDYFIVNSEATKKDFYIQDKTFLLPNAVDCDELDIENNTIGNLIRVGIISSNLPKKGIDDFVSLANACKKDLPNIHFFIIGPENEFINELKHSCNNLKNLHFLPYQETAKKALEQVNIIVSFSHFAESFGRTVIEAMAARKPVIAYNWGAIPELITHEHNGFLINYKKPLEAIPYLQRLSKDSNFFKKLGENGRSTILKKYSMTIYSEKMSLIFDKIRKQSGIQAKTLRIGYFLWHFPVPSETFVLNELRILVNRGYDVLVFCKESPYKDFKPDFPIIWERISSIEHFAVRMQETKRNIMHAHFVFPTVTNMLWPACIKANVPFTFIAHSQDIFIYENDKQNKIDQITNSNLCQRIFVPSRFHLKYIIERNVPSHKIIINPNGIDPLLYGSGGTRYYKNNKIKKICAVHRFTEKKGLDLLIKSASYLNHNIQINIYGYGELEETYKQLIIDLKLDNVKILNGLKSREELLAVFNTHDLFACPSIRAKNGDMDGIPTVLMEAMSSGIPVITTNISGIPDLVTDEITGIITESNPKSIAESILRFFSLPETKMYAIIDAAKNHIQTNFNANFLINTFEITWKNDLLNIIIVSWNNLLELKEVIRRILKYTTLPYKLVICDNHSKPDVIEFLEQLENNNKHVKVIYNHYNAMVGPGTNIAINTLKTKYCIYVCGKEGFVFDYGWEKPLIEYMENNTSVGLAGTLAYSPTYKTGIDYPKGISMFKKFRNKSFAYDNPSRNFFHVQGGFFILRRSMYEKIGGFSQEVPHNYTDVEYSYYIESCGWKLGNIPSMLALYNKSRPTLFSRISENIKAFHPPLLEELPLLESVIKKNTHFCNLCNWYGDSFQKYNDLTICPKCKSNPMSRSLYRYLSESTLTFQRLIALGVNLPTGIESFWKIQFQGDIISLKEFTMLDSSTTRFNDNAVNLIYLNCFAQEFKYLDLFMNEAHRILKKDGIFILQITSDESLIESLQYLLKEKKISISYKTRFDSAVCHYDHNYIYTLKVDTP